jgi:type II secretory pathway pseudopilin PulG
LVEVVVASGLMGVALVVLLGNLSTVVIGGRVAERRIVEERLARNQMEQLFVQTNVATPCTSSAAPQSVVDNITYRITITACAKAHYDEYTVRVEDASNAATTLTDDRWKP